MKVKVLIIAGKSDNPRSRAGEKDGEGRSTTVRCEQKHKGAEQQGDERWITGRREEKQSVNEGTNKTGL